MDGMSDESLHRSVPPTIGGRVVVSCPAGALSLTGTNALSHLSGTVVQDTIDERLGGERVGYSAIFAARWLSGFVSVPWSGGVWGRTAGLRT